MRFKHITLTRTALSAAIATVLGSGAAYGVGPTCGVSNGASGGVVTVVDIGGGVGNNFTMSTSAGDVWGGENGVAACWDGTQNTSASSTNFNIALTPSTLFSGYMWTAHHIRVFGPGTYVINTTCTTTQLEAGTCAASGTSAENYTLTVAAGQLGAHMLFDWNGNPDIDVINVWQPGTFAPTFMFTTPTDGGNANTNWNQMSIDIDGDGDNGQQMIDGPFAGFNANFNLMLPARPSASNDASSTTESVAKTAINVAANDTGVNSTLSISSAASNGTCAVVSGKINYTPTTGYVGSDSCQYTIGSSAGYGVTATATLSLTVTNTAPTANNQSTSTAQNTPLTNFALSYTDPGTDIDVTTVTIADSNGGTAGNTAQGGTATDNNDGTVNYTPPNAGFTGDDTFTYTIGDSNGGTSNSATVTVTVYAGAQPPSAQDDTATTAKNNAVSINVLSNDSAGAAAIDVTTVVPSDPPNGTAVDNNDGTVTYTPDADFAGTDTFTYTVQDTNTNTSSAATVTVTVTNVAPVANDDSDETTQGVATVIDVTANDTDSDGTVDDTTVVPSDPPHGTAADNNNGTVTYTPDADFSGTDTFTYTVNDNNGDASNEATVTVTVNATDIAVSDGDITGGNGTMTYAEVVDGGADPDTDMQHQCVGGCFDFVITGVTDEAVTVVLPLSEPIPSTRSDRIHYRKWIGGDWVNFTSGSGNALESAPAVSPGVCPPAGDASYDTGLTAGDECVALTIVDNGDFDSNGTLGTVADPGGIGYTVPGTIPEPQSGVNSGGAGGCSVNGQTGSMQHTEWWLVGGFLTWLGMLVRRSRRS